VTQSRSVTAARLRQAELRRGTTLFGPQKDEVDLLINDGLVRETASQGQHKSLLVALKLAECDVLHRARNERPVVLLDDVFSELDRTRIERVMQGVLAMGMQCFVTTTEGDGIGHMVPSGTDVLTATLARGRIIDERRTS
jgi:DNA replication and repair protein RecF